MKEKSTAVAAAAAASTSALEEEEEEEDIPVPAAPMGDWTANTADSPKITSEEESVEVEDDDEFEDVDTTATVGWRNPLSLDDEPPSVNSAQVCAPLRQKPSRRRPVLPDSAHRISPSVSPECLRVGRLIHLFPCFSNSLTPSRYVARTTRVATIGALTKRPQRLLLHPRSPHRPNRPRQTTVTMTRRVAAMTGVQVATKRLRWLKVKFALTMATMMHGLTRRSLESFARPSGMRSRGSLCKLPG